MAPQWLETIFSVPDGVIYLLLFVTALVENLFPFAPGDTVTIFGGYLIGIGRLSPPAAFVLVTIATWCGFMAYYGMGRWLGRTRAHALLESWVAVERLHAAEDWLRAHGHWIVLVNRFVAGTRLVISVAAGFANLRPGMVAAFALAGCVLWNGLVMAAGYAIGEEWAWVNRIIHAYNVTVLTVLALLAILLLLHWWNKWRRRT